MSVYLSVIMVARHDGTDVCQQHADSCIDSSLALSLGRSRALSLSLSLSLSRARARSIALSFSVSLSRLSDVSDLPGARGEQAPRLSLQQLV